MRHMTGTAGAALLEVLGSALAFVVPAAINSSLVRVAGQAKLAVGAGTQERLDLAWCVV